MDLNYAYKTSSSAVAPATRFRLKKIIFTNTNGAPQQVSAYIGTDNTGNLIFRDGINSQRSSGMEFNDILVSSIYVELGTDCKALVIYE